MGPGTERGDKREVKDAAYWKAKYKSLKAKLRQYEEILRRYVEVLRQNEEILRQNGLLKATRKATQPNKVETPAPKHSQEDKEARSTPRRSERLSKRKREPEIVDTETPTETEKQEVLPTPRKSKIKKEKDNEDDWNENTGV